MACTCGGRPKRGAPPLSILRWQDVPLPILNFGRNFAGFPPTPPLGSGIWAEDTVFFCNRNPDTLYLEFPPFEGGVLTTALKGLWGRNCECKPVLGVWEYTFSYQATGTASNGDPLNYSATRVSRGIGALLGVTQNPSQGNGFARVQWFGYRAVDNYVFNWFLSGDVIVGRDTVVMTSQFNQKLVEPGCPPPGSPPPPRPPSGFPDPYPVNPVPPILPPELIVIPPPPRFGIPRPEEDECCDCC